MAFLLGVAKSLIGVTAVVAVGVLFVIVFYGLKEDTDGPQVFSKGFAVLASWLAAWFIGDFILGLFV